ncbi:MAG: hypothetical protein ABI207_09305 [Crocinitomicaceae bacterium]
MEIKTVEQALEKLNLPSDTKPVITGVDAEFTNILEKVFQALVISKAMREGWEPDYENLNENKFESWFDLNTDEFNPSGFRFIVSVCTDAATGSVIGPLLCQETREASDHFGELMVPIFRDVLKPQK